MLPITSGDVQFKWKSLDGRQYSQIVPPYCLYWPDNPKTLTAGAPKKGLYARYYDMKSEYCDNTGWENWEGKHSYPKPNKGNKLNYDMLNNQHDEEKVAQFVDILNENWLAGSPDHLIGADYFVSEWNGKIILKTRESSGLFR